MSQLFIHVTSRKSSKKVVSHMGSDHVGLCNTSSNKNFAQPATEKKNKKRMRDGKVK